MTKIIGTKIKMSQLFQDGRVIPVSLVRITDEKQLGEVKAGDPVKVVGISKGKGFQGVVKRHGFGGGPKTHGQKNRQRAPGSIGNTTPQRVLPGRRMAGHMGVDTVSIRTTLITIDTEKKIVALKGPLPGNNRDTVTIMSMK